MIFLLQAFQTFIALTYPVFTYISSTEEPTKDLSLKPFFIFFFIITLILTIHGIDSLKLHYIRKAKAQNVLLILKFAVFFPIILILFFTLLFVSSVSFLYKLIVSFAMLLITTITIIADTEANKYGMQEIFFAVLTIPSIFMSANIILYNEMDFKLFTKFGPVNFLFLGSLVCSGSKKEFLSGNSKGSVWSLARLLGRQDSFRTLFLMFAYCYLHGITESLNDLSLKHMVPTIVFSPCFYKILKTFREQKYDKSFSIMWKTYVTFSMLFLVCSLVI